MDTTLDDTRSLSAIFESADKAERAVSWLLNIGLRDSQIRQTAAVPNGAGPAVAQPAAPKPRRGLFDSLVDLVMSDDRPKGSGRSLAGAGPRRVTVLDIKAAMRDTVARILSDEGEIEAAAVPNGKTDSVAANDGAADSGEVKANAEMRPAGLPGAGAIKGLLGACLVDSESGLVLASEGGAAIDLNQIAALDTEFLRMWRQIIDQLHLHERIEEMDELLMTLDTQIHLLHPLERDRSIFLFVALDKASCNLGMARLQLRSIEAGLAG